MHRSLLLLVFCLALCGCNGDQPAPVAPTPPPAPTPTPAPPPTPPPPPPTPTHAALTGFTRNTSGQLIGFITVTVMDGPDTGRNATSDGGGAYRLENLATGNINLSAKASGWLEDRRGVFHNGTNTLDFTLAPAPPPTGPELEIKATQLNASGGASEWQFEATGHGSFKSYNWDFGDGGAASNSRSTESHVYTASGVYVVRVNAVPTAGGPNVTATLTITVSL